ncbi:M48 family metallopeptidase [Streptomyces indicus]|uniref:Zn-dependent protease with chaperone function n=1 Tax=Streptomyces indicus TaxID=417292 RepID=A0A1G8T5H3_9ACTN|nr:M48 family metallopeptidase [Streptomyces indicus]SDJ36723.1 Zn-dependent protease with chaperone function [Streptomyces indicus]
METKRVETEPCPQCGAGMPVHAGHVVWCRACDWNVAPELFVFGLDRTAERRAEVAGQRAEQVYQELVRTGDFGRRSRWTAARIAAYALSCGVTGAAVAVAAGAVALLVTGWWNPLSLALGLALLLFSAVLRPWVPPLPRQLPRLDRKSAPRLFALVDKVAREVGTRGVDLVVLVPGFNAYVTSRRPRQRVLTLGLTLWETLTPQQRVALLGHELGHFTNGDTRHGLVVGNALTTLACWRDVLDPGRWRGGRLRYWFGHGVLRWPWYAADGLLRLIDRLSLRDATRAEFLADELAARVASSEAAYGLAERLLHADRAVEALDALLADGVLDWRRAPWKDAARAALDLPDHERERLLRLSQLRWHYEDDTHPPTHLRLALARQRAYDEARVTCGPQQAEAVDRELARAVSAVAAHGRMRVRRN